MSLFSADLYSETDDVTDLSPLHADFKRYSKLEKLPRSRIEVTPTALLRYHAHTRWTLTFDLDL